MGRAAVLVAFFIMIVMIVGIITFAVNQRMRIKAKSGDAGDGEELRRLAEMAVTTQEHNDLTLREITGQLNLLREQMDSVQQILKQVE